MRMPTAPIAAALAVCLSLLTTADAGQWPSYPSPGLPRTPDGKPILSAPAPRAADGKPDLSGLWHVEGSGLVNGYTWNVAQDLDPTDVQPWARSLYRERILNLAKDSPMAHCLPRGLAASNAFGAVFTRIVQTSSLIVITYGGDGAPDVHRHIFTDGRTLPEDPNPTWVGYSVGRWEGETLVVTTAGFNDRGWLDFHGHPQTESLRVTERLRRRDVGHMDYEMTLTDPTVFAKPVSMRMDKVLVPDTELTETVCENEKDAGHLVGGNGFRMTSEDLSRYSGTFEFEAGRQVTLTNVDGILFFQEGATGMRRALVPQSETIFVFRDNGDGVEFMKDSQGTVIRFIVHGARPPGAGDPAAERVTKRFSDQLR